MSKFHLAAAAAAFLIPVGAAQAAEVNGGELTLRFSAFTDDTDFNATALEGSLELGFTRELAVQLDVAQRFFGLIDDNTLTGTLHGIYHLSDLTSVGLFVGTESGAGSDLDYYGVEAGHEMMGWELEGYLGRGEDSGFDGIAAGLTGAYAVTPDFDVAGSVDHLDLDGGISATRLGLKGEYGFGNGLSVYGEVGNYHAKAGGASNSEPFVGIGASYKFGAERGTTFQQRGLARLIPGL
ncbi:hypothetical protein [Oceaniglobus roseus]|uniref:hypothetical protein n=1 Tax=Oceaniglobus roseus TaxID=1737570 RepID=UPI000C7F58F7|nr:hypothetical protein [Kandeliimicrobium roseum]